MRTASGCPGRETGLGRTRGGSENGRDAVLGDRRDDRTEWLRREGGIEGRMAEVDKKNYSTGGGQIMIEGRRVAGKEKRIQCDCCLQPTHLLVKYPVLYPRENMSPSPI